jgi:hypothetical protein
MMMNGHMIDSPHFEDATQSWRLAAAIFTLRSLGWPITTIDVPCPTAKMPNRVIARYRLDRKHVAQALALLGRGSHGA